MAYTRGSDVGVFTAGWWSQVGSTLQSIIEPFTAGWFSSFNNVIVNQTTKIVNVKNGVHSVTIERESGYKTFSKLPSFLTQKCSARYNGERELIQVLSQEAVTKFGIATQYYRISYNEDGETVDMIFGENQNRTVLSVWDNIMMWYRLERENRIWSKFGIDSNDSITANIPKAHFMHITNGYIPNPGDVFIENGTGRAFEILERKEGDPISVPLQSRQYMWELKCVLYSRQEFLNFTNDTKNTKLYTIMSSKDKLDIRDVVDVKKEEVLYKPSPTEKPQQNPFQAW